MLASRAFELKIKQAEKHQRQHEDFNLTESLSDSYGRIINIPATMAQELFTNFYPQREKLFLTIDLFNNDLTAEDKDLLTLEEWSYLIELTNRFASEIDLTVLQEVMQYFLDIDVLNT